MFPKLTGGITPAHVTQAQEFIEKKGGSKISISQLRNFYGEIKKLEQITDPSKFSIGVTMLKPKLYYAASRDGKAEMRDFVKMGLTPLLTEVDNETDHVQKKQLFKTFCQLFEAIVAFHKFSTSK